MRYKHIFISLFFFIFIGLLHPINVSANTIYWQDTFDRADGNVNNYWNAYNGATAQIVSNSLRRTDSGNYRTYYNSTDVTLPADYYVTITVPHSTINRSYWGLLGRYTPENNTGNKVFWETNGSESIQAGHATYSSDISITVTGGYPDTWSQDQEHAITLGYSGTTVTIYLDGAEYGYYTDSTNNTTGTSVAIVGDGGGTNFDVSSIQITDYLPNPIFEFTSIAHANVNSSATTVTWQTALQPSSSTVEYGSTSSYGSFITNASLVTSHSSTLSSLSANTVYHYRVSSTNAGNTTIASSDETFLTDSNGGIIYWQDTFDRANGDVNNSWVGPSGATAQIVSNSLRRTDSGSYRVYYNPANSDLPADYFVTMLVPNTTVTRNWWGLVGRYFRNNDIDTGLKILWRNSGYDTFTVGNADYNSNITQTITDGIPSTWGQDRDHLVTLGYVGNVTTIYLDGQEYGYFTSSVNNQTGTGVGIVGDGGSSNFDVKDILVTNYIPGSAVAVTNFNVPTSSSNLIISISSFVPTDVSDVTGYLVNESSSTPDVDDENWSESAPANYTFSNLGMKTLYAWTKNAAGNISTSSIDTIDIVDSTAPVISLVSSSLYSDQAIISWSTNESSSSKINYGLTNSYGSTTTETDTNPRVTSHSVTLANLVICSTYHYRVKSSDNSDNEVVSVDKSFTTTGCVGSAAIEDQTESAITAASGGQIELLSSGTGLTLDIVAGATDSNANYQIKKLNSTSVINTTSTPTNYSLVGDYTYDLKSLTNNSTYITTLNNAQTITINYTDSDISGLDESTLTIYRWNGTAWAALSNCVINTSANTVACETTNFSTFALFSQASSSKSSSSSSSDSSATDTTCEEEKPTGKAPNLYAATKESPTSTLLYFSSADGPKDHYILEYGKESGNYIYAKDNIGDQDSRTTLVNDLNPNTKYYFRIRAANKCAAGDWSNELAATTGEYFKTNNLKLTTTSLTQKPKQVIEKGKITHDIEENKYKVNIEVLDENNNPVVGASVTLHSTPRKAVTNGNGIATFEDVEEGNHRVIIDYDNFNGEQTINLNSDTEEFHLKIVIAKENIIYHPLVKTLTSLLIITTVIMLIALFKLRKSR